MPRPFTLFTGQWADLPLEEVCRRRPGLRLRRPRTRLLGRPLRGRQGTVRPRLPGRPASTARQVRTEVLGDLQPPGRPGRLRRPDRRAAPGDPARPHLGRRRARRGPPPGRRGDQGHRAGGRRLRCAHRRGLHRLVDLAPGRDVPARSAAHDRAGIRGLRRALEPDPGRLRRGGCAVRPRGAPQRDRVRLLDHAPRPGGRRSPDGVRAELRPQPLRLAGPGPGQLPVRLPGPDLPRGLQGGTQAPRRPQR